MTFRQAQIYMGGKMESRNISPCSELVFDTSYDLLLEWIRLSPYSYESMLFIVRHIPTAFHNGLYKIVSNEVRKWCIEQQTLTTAQKKKLKYNKNNYKSTKRL
jgi:hypothetical protein